MINFCWENAIKNVLINEGGFSSVFASQIIPVPSESLVPDATDKFLILDPNQNHVAFAICSNNVAPKLMQRRCTRLRAAKQTLPEKLA